MRRQSEGLAHLEGHDVTVMGEAFHAAGVKTPEQQAMDMLDWHWPEHKPDITATLTAFADDLRDRYPVIVAVMGEAAFLARVRAFAIGPSDVGGGHPEIRKIVARLAEAGA